MNAMQPPQSVEEVKATLETTEKGGVRQSIRNCLTVFQRDPVLAGAIAYNILTDRKDIIKPIGFHRESTALTDTDMKYLLLYLEETYGLTSEKKIETAIGIVANENKYHPIRDFLNSLAWDGTERIRFCLRHFLGADVDDYTYEALKLFMLGAITRAFKPGSKFEIMLCLVGGQGAGKSTFFRLLAVRDEWFSDDLRKLDDDNVYRKLQGHWIIEMSEMMATANAKSIEEIKSFLSRQKEVYKIPYETHPADRPRQCVFGGTSNALDFLPLDRSGNRRFIPVMVYPEQAEVHILEDEAASRAYIEQMWAEAMEIYRSGRFKLAFSPAMQRYLKEHQRDFMPEDTKAGMIQAYLEKSRDYRCRPYEYQIENSFMVTSENYVLGYKASLIQGVTPVQIRERMEKLNPDRFRVRKFGVSDVIVTSIGGKTQSYYVNPKELIKFNGFFTKLPNGEYLLLNEEGYQVEGQKGTWTVTDEKTIDEQRFVLMVNDQKPDLLPSIVVQSDGKFITSTASGFDNATVRKVRDLLHHEKFLENGTAERARESGTEQNYNMIDGCVNNVPKKPRVIGGRVSVLDRLHIKQAERARKDNAQVQQQERTRKN